MAKREERPNPLISACKVHLKASTCTSETPVLGCDRTFLLFRKDLLLAWRLVAIENTVFGQPICPSCSTGAFHLGRYNIFIWDIFNSYMCSCLKNEELASVSDRFCWETCRSPFICQRSEEDPLAVFLSIYPMELCCRVISCGGCRNRLSQNVLSARKYSVNTQLWRSKESRITSL